MKPWIAACLILAVCREQSWRSHVSSMFYQTADESLMYKRLLVHSIWNHHQQTTCVMCCTTEELLQVNNGYL